MSLTSKDLPQGAYVQRIDSKRCSSYGWQARVEAGGQRLTKFFSDGRHGGYWAAMLRAEQEALRMYAAAHNPKK